MSDERADLILNMLRAIRAEQSAQREKLDEIIVRLGRLEREVAGLHSDYAGLSVRLDNLDRRVGRIEQRLELVEKFQLPADVPQVRRVSLQRNPPYGRTVDQGITAPPTGPPK